MTSQNPLTRQAISNPLDSVFEAGRNALGYADGGSADNPHRIAKPAVSSNALELDAFVDLGDPAPAGVYNLNLQAILEAAPLDPAAVISEWSAVAHAGARIIIAQPRDKLLPVDGQKLQGLMGFYKDTALVRAIDPAPFGAVADGADVATSPWPLHDATLAWLDAPSGAFSTVITRPQNFAVGGGQALRAALLVSILRGLGQYADEVLLAAIQATSPAAFSLGAAASRALRFENLSALIGTAGTGASINAAGQLVAGPGIKGELTAAMAGTVVGAFGRAAVAVWPELTVHAKRLTVDGSVQLIVFANVQAAVPDAGAFWSVA